MGNAEIKKILEYIEKLLATNEEKCYEAEKKMYANKEMAIEDRVHNTIDFCEYNAVRITLRGIIALIKGSFETEKFWEEKKKEEQLRWDEKEIILDEKDIMRKTILKQLKGLLNQSQADAITDLEFGLDDRGIKDKEIYQIFKYRLEGVIHVIHNTDYGPEKNRKIIEIISKLYESKIL